MKKEEFKKIADDVQTAAEEVKKDVETLLDGTLEEIAGGAQGAVDLEEDGLCICLSKAGS
ncbi:hypothetical protein [Proteiniphilum sp.]|uniref:hypothetical protein n=1 Tax=Proteiniphilum sp. TaxID=1926877 RepID=UPI003321F736